MDKDKIKKWACIGGVVLVVAFAVYWFMFRDNLDGSRVQRIDDDIKASQESIGAAAGELNAGQERLSDATSTAERIGESNNAAQESAGRVERSLDECSRGLDSSKQGIDRCIEILETARAGSGESESTN